MSTGAQLNCDTILIRNVTVVSGVCVLFWASTLGLFIATINMCPKWSSHKRLCLSRSVHTWLYNTSPRVSPTVRLCLVHTSPLCVQISTSRVSVLKVLMPFLPSCAICGPNNLWAWFEWSHHRYMLSAVRAVHLWSDYSDRMFVPVLNWALEIHVKADTVSDNRISFSLLFEKFSKYCHSWF